MKEKVSVKEGRKRRDKKGYLSEGIWVAEVLHDNTRGKVEISKQTLYMGPTVDQEEVDFWEERLDDLKVPYVLAVIEFNEKDDILVGERGQAIFVDPQHENLRT